MRMILWEYKLLEVSADATPEIIQTTLNREGSLGWELAFIRDRQVIRIQKTINRVILVLKRPTGYVNNTDYRV